MADEHEDDPGVSHLGGWLDLPERHEVAADIPLYGDFRPILEAKPAKPILLYKAWKLVLGSYPSYPAQEIGDCVSFGHGHANDLLQCIEIVLGEPSAYAETATEWIYGESRKVAGILGPFDGSYGAAAVKAMTKVGLLTREKVGPYSGRRAKQWGGRGGPPVDLEDDAAPFKLGAVARIDTNEAAISALWAGCPITICSNCGFDGKRDEQGHIRQRGSWAHCMFIAGYDPGLDRFCICNSWGDRWPGGPTYLDQPAFSFWADADVVERKIFSAQDSWALMRAPEFKHRSIPSELVAA